MDSSDSDEVRRLRETTERLRAENLRLGEALLKDSWGHLHGADLRRAWAEWSGESMESEEGIGFAAGWLAKQDSTGNPGEGASSVAHQQTPAGSRHPEVHRGPAGEGIAVTFRGEVLRAGELPDEAEDGTPAPTVRGMVLECENSDVLRAIATLVSQGERMFRLEVL